MLRYLSTFLIGFGLLINTCVLSYAASTASCYDTDCKLMLHANTSLAFDDTSSTNHAMTTWGGAQISTSQYKFGLSSSYFDGTGDYLTVPYSSDFYFATGDFTIDFWVRFDALTSASFFNNTSTGGSTFVIRWTGTGWQFYSDGSQRLLVSDSLATATWYHVALVRNGTSIVIYRDGTSLGSTTDSWDTNNNSGTIYIGIRDTLVQPLNGYIDELRVSNTARWTSNFTPETSEYTSDSNTKLLLHFNGSNNDTAFYDWSSGHKILTTYGNTSIDDTQSKFSNHSYRFTGTGDYITIPTSSDWAFGTNDFTIDFWVRFFSVSAITRYFCRTDSLNFAVAKWDTGNLVVTIESSNVIDTAWSPSIDIWYHVTVTRNGTNLRAFIDGSQIGSTITNSTDIGNSMLIVGGQTSGACLNGWLDELRIIKGLAVWTSNFTPPSSEYTECAGGRRRICSVVTQ